MAVNSGDAGHLNRTG